MLSFDLEKHDSAFRYAFSLAMKSHLSDFLNTLNENKAEDDDIDGTIKAQDTCFYIQHVLYFVFKKVLLYFKENDVRSNLDCINPTDTLSCNLEQLLLGAKKTSADIKRKIKTENIIENIEKDSRVQKPPVWLLCERELELSEKLGLVMKGAIRLKGSKFTQGTNISDFGLLSLLCAHYLQFIVEGLSQEISLSEFSTMRLDFVIEALKSSVDHSSISKLDADKLYETFKCFLLSYLEISHSNELSLEINTSLVNKLREQGNNLMANLSYAHAIVIYTQALDTCALPSAYNIPQLLTNRAIAYIGLNCFPEAMNDLNEALMYDRTFTPAWTQLGYCHLYMGTSLVALQCQLMSIKAVSGEILPEGYALYEKEEDIQRYKKNKISSILPQFIERLVQGIILTERRANQQREPAAKVRETVENICSILDRLKAEFPDDDQAYFSYHPNNEISSLRPIAQRVNRSRPSILTEDVAQDLMASSGVEASTIAIPTTSITSLERLGRNRDAAGTNNARTQGNTVRTIPTGIGNILNDFGEMFESGVSNAAAQPSDSNQAEQGQNTESNLRGEQDRNISINAGSPPPHNDHQNAMSDVLRGFFPENMAGNIGSIISLSFGRNLNASRQSPSNNNSRQEPSNSSNNPSNGSNERRTNDADAMAEDPE